MLFSCDDKNPSQIIITGRVSNLTGELHLEGTGLHLIKPDDNKEKFTFVADLSQPGYLKLKSYQSEIILFLFPGSHLHVDFDDKDWISTIKYSGNSVPEQTFLREYVRIYNCIVDTFDSDKYYSLEPNEFLKKTDHFCRLFTELLDDTHSLDSFFKKTETARITYSWARNKNTYPKNHFLYTQRKAQLPADYFCYINDSILSDTSLMRFSDYTDFLKTFVEAQYYLKVENDAKLKYNRHLKIKLLLDIIEKDFAEPRIRDFLYTYAMISQIEILAVDSSDLKRFGRICKNNSYKSGVQVKYDSLSSLMKGRPAPKFLLADQSGKSVSLDDCRGKYVYIDFWTASSAACLREMPYYDPLTTDYKDKNIVFLGVCIESGKEAWDKIMKEKKPMGIQIWLDKEQTDLIKKDFKITSKPTYVLIDKEGNYFESRASSPTENIRFVFNGLEGL
jgi:peroxiredoxin